MDELGRDIINNSGTVYTFNDTLSEAQLLFLKNKIRESKLRKNRIGVDEETPEGKRKKRIIL
jgi:hypothetical protein